MPMPRPRVSHVLLVVGPDMLPAHPVLSRVVPEGIVDDTPYRLSLMAIFARLNVGDTIQVENPSQVWAFWEQFAIPSGYSLAVIECAAPQAAVVAPSLPTRPDAAVGPASAPNTSGIGRA
jgi:hypothetical protein